MPITTINHIIPIKNEKELKMIIARSFDINKPNSAIQKLTGGVLGGSIIKGTIKEGDEIEIYPGVNIDNKYEPLKTKVACSVEDTTQDEPTSVKLAVVGVSDTELKSCEPNETLDEPPPSALFAVDL